MPIKGAPTQRTPRVQRALRLATGTALCLAISYGLALPIPFISPVLAVLLLASLNRPLPFKAGLILALAAMLTTGVGLLLIPILRYYPITGVLLIGVSLFLAFGFGLRGGNTLIMTFLIIGLTMISSAGVADFDLAMMVIGALVMGLILAVIVVAFSHWLFPDPANAPLSTRRQRFACAGSGPGCTACDPDCYTGVPVGTDRPGQLPADHFESGQPWSAEFDDNGAQRCS